jgi:hypothetical protein
VLAFGRNSNPAQKEVAEAFARFVVTPLTQRNLALQREEVLPVLGSMRLPEGRKGTLRLLAIAHGRAPQNIRPTARELGAGDHLGRRVRRAQPGGGVAERQVGNARHRRDPNAPRYLDIPDCEHFAHSVITSIASFLGTLCGAVKARQQAPRHRPSSPSPRAPLDRRHELFGRHRRRGRRNPRRARPG